MNSYLAAPKIHHHTNSLPAPKSIKKLRTQVQRLSPQVASQNPDCIEWSRGFWMIVEGAKT